MNRPAPLLHRLSRDRRGTATIEFALWASCFFLVILGALDFGIWRTYQLRLGAAIEQGALMAFNGRDTLDQGTAEGIARYVATAAHLPGAAVSVHAICNGGTSPCASAAAERTCACISTSGGANHFAAAACGSDCPDAATAGYYLTISADYPYAPVVLPRGMMGPPAISDSATVRLQ